MWQRLIVVVLTGGLVVLVMSALLPGQETKRSAPPAPPKEAARKAVVPAGKTTVKAVRRLAAPGAVMKVQVPTPLPLAPPLPPGANPDAQIQQFAQQLNPFLRAEWHRLRAACLPTAEQLPTLRRDAERALHEAAKTVAEEQTRRNRGQWQTNDWDPDPDQLVADKLLEAVKDHLTPEQWARYRAEVEGRTRDRRKSSIEDLVASLDTKLALTPDRREKLVASLTEHWDKSWGGILEQMGLRNNWPWIPNIPDQLVVPYLDESQTPIWRGIVKQQNIFFGLNLHNGTGIVLEEDPPAGAEGDGNRRTPEGKAEVPGRQP